MSSKLESASTARLPRRRAARGKRLRRRLLLLAALVLALLSPAIYSYVTTMLKPSSLPLSIRSVEWVRAHGGASFVDSVERFYYSHRAPKKGGPPLRALPTIGARRAPAHAGRPAGARRPRSVSRPRSAARARAGTYAPAPLAPLVKPRLPGEGAWSGSGPLVHGAPGVRLTEFRSDPTYPRLVAYVAWIDHTRTQLALYPGRYEPPAGSPRGPMQVPYGERWRLLATFNSGFTYRDGHGGFAVDGHVYEPLQRGLATAVAHRDGRVDVVAWHGGAAPPSGIVLARQNLPLIVDHGRASPNLSDGPAWGATLGNAIRVWRSGLGVDRKGNLIYAAADYQTVGSLAAILIHAGAVRAMELDINAEWPSLITYDHHGGLRPTKVVPNAQQSAGRYLSPDDRDFFAVLRRVPGPGRVPFR